MTSGATSEATESAGMAVDDATYGLVVDPANAFEAARDIVRQLHSTLLEAKADKLEAGAAAPFAQKLQLQLLSLRRAHRAMVKSGETGKAAEVVSRRLADAEFAYLETKRYESACCRAAACYCRCFPTPELAEVRPFLGGPATVEGEQAEEEQEVRALSANGAGVGKSLATSLRNRMETEHRERCRLAEQLDNLDRQRKEDFDSFSEIGAVGADLVSKLFGAEAALEPVCNLLELRPSKRGSAAPRDAAALASAPLPLRLIHKKFEVLAAFGSTSGFSVVLEGFDSAEGGEPPAKKPRTEGQFVRVSITKTVALQFACAQTPGSDGTSETAYVVGVAATGAPDALLDELWPKDDGTTGPVAAVGAAANVPGRAYGWAQVLGGLRQQAATLLEGAPAGAGGPLADGSTVTASDVVHRVRKRLAAGPLKKE